MSAPRWPLEPLYDLCRNPDDTRRSQGELGERLGRSQKTIGRWEAEGGVPDSCADEIAVRAGYLPWVIWPEWIDYTLTLPEIPTCKRGHPRVPGGGECRECVTERRAAAKKVAA